MSLFTGPVLVPLSADAQVCANLRCSTLLAADAELCDECGGSRLEGLDASTFTLLCGWAADRPVVFRLFDEGPAVIGRSSGAGVPPDIDLGRFPASHQVHRRHAQLDRSPRGGWRLTHLGINPLVVDGSQRTVVQPGNSTSIRPGDTLEISGVRLQFITRALAGSG